jgi:hypothetical protein
VLPGSRISARSAITCHRRKGTEASDFNSITLDKSGGYFAEKGVNGGSYISFGQIRVLLSQAIDQVRTEHYGPPMSYFRIP